MQMTWARLGAGLVGALGGAALGAVLGFIEANVVVAASTNLLGFRDQDGMIILAAVPFGAVHGGVIGLIVELGVQKICGWGLGAVVGLGVWAPLFLWGGHHESNAVMLLALLMPLLCGGIGAAVRGRLPSKSS